MPFGRDGADQDLVKLIDRDCISLKQAVLAENILQGHRDDLVKGAFLPAFMSFRAGTS